MAAAARTMPLTPVAYFKAPAVAQASASQQKPFWKKPWLYVAIGAVVAVLVVVSSGDDTDTESPSTPAL